MTDEKKTVVSRFGKITLHIDNEYAQCRHGFKMTPYMQDLVLSAGKDDNYKAAQETITRFLRVGADDSQINRVCSHYGSLMEQEQTEIDSELVEKAEESAKSLHADENVYAMSDGCMLPTREDGGGYNEMKLGRVFTQSSRLDLGDKPNIIRKSLYANHFGEHTDFSEKFQNIVDPYERIGERLVFINDGALWIDNFIRDNYPKATNILDYYHAVEYLNNFSKVFFKDKTKRKKWVDEQTAFILNDEVSKVIVNIKIYNPRGKVKQAAQNKILTYYRRNESRMQYKTFRERGLLIGSGPIESAHRFVLQKRLKQSGQKWTKEGAQAVANLRVAHLNGMWSRVLDFVRGKAA